MLAEHGLYELLRAAGIRPASATQRISARNATAAEARLLGETNGAALLTMERIARDGSGAAVEYGRHLYRPGRYAFTIQMPAGTAVLAHGG
jgi:DNA-binding GntR family transcriptional regulator